MPDLPVGWGGRQRQIAIDKEVDKAVNGTSKPLPSNMQPGTASTQGQTHPSAAHVASPYTPSEQERKTRSYGSPISEPLVGQGKGK